MLGRVFQCPECKDVRAHVYRHGGGRAWIKVAPGDVEFYRLLESESEDESSTTPMKAGESAND